MTDPTKTRIPAPLYAAAGAGDLAYEQLRKLPAVVTELREKATAGTVDLRHRATVGTVELRERAVARLKAANASAVELRDKANTTDFDRLREVALRNASAVLASAQAVYTELVARGERVVGSGVVQAADTVNADIEVTEAPAELPTATPETPAKPATPAKAVKRTRPAAAK
ncbi:MAG TPA: hypothetical protein VFR67_31185 [Pilimelia sp.]|nr:hypothetical protein [Pilimelia sp.]